MDARPIASIPITRPHLPPVESFSEVVADLFASRMLSNFAKYAGLLESRAAAVLDHPAPLCVSSCDIGLTLAWRALECSAGEVIVPSFTFCSTVNALIWNGLEPVFADVDPRTYCIDVEDARDLITPRTVGIAAVHAFGLPADIEPLETLAREHDLRLVFDAAHGLGGRYRDLALGAFGDASIFSLSGTKLVTGGEGGLVTVSRSGRCRAIFVLAGLWVQRRLQLPIHRPQRQAFGAECGPRLALARSARTDPGPPPWPGPAISTGPIRLRRSDLAGGALRLHPRIQGSGRAVSQAGSAARSRRGRPRGRGQGRTKRYFFPVHRMDVYRKFARRALPATDWLRERLLCIPLYFDLPDARIDSIAQLIRASLIRASAQEAA